MREKSKAGVRLFHYVQRRLAQETHLARDFTKKTVNFTLLSRARGGDLVVAESEGWKRGRLGPKIKKNATLRFFCYFVIPLFPVFCLKYVELEPLKTKLIAWWFSETRNSGTRSFPLYPC